MGMMQGRRIARLALLLSACGSEVPPPARAPASEIAVPDVVPPTRMDVGAEPPAEPAPDPIDPATVEAVDVVVVNILDPGGPPCGILHSVAAIEVEVVGGGPTLGLYVSCPADLRPRGMLTVGEHLHAELFAEPQRWPKPAHRLEETTTIRYVRTLSRLRPDPSPNLSPNLGRVP